MESYEDEELSLQEKKELVTKFISYAPPGEVDDVIRGLKCLVNKNSDIKQAVQEARLAYDQVQFEPVQLADDSKTLLTSHGLMDNSDFYDPTTNKAFSYDPILKKVKDLGIKDDPSPSNVKEYRKEVDKAIQNYISLYYPDGVACVYGKNDDSSPMVVVCIEDHKYSPNNFWNGKWRSEWKAVISGDQASLTGVIKSQVHYYEDGNVQLVSSRECKDTFMFSDEESFADSLVNSISRFEHDYQTAVNQNYADMSDKTFKALRRQLPVTRTKVDWDKICSYKIGSELQA